ncbi:hypothetical protein GF362_00800 [Candidatus Dojkabacteria bacterium]|nr:hypothetical protein [Candidatus Dojkabacteria bacterium]
MILDIVYLGSLFFVNFIVGLISWPISNLFFRKLSDNGYSLSHIFGWIAISYIAFFLVSLKILPNTLFSILLIVVFWLFINLLIKEKFNNIKISEINWHQVAFIQILFLLLIGFLYWVRGHGSEIYQIERFMDFGFIQSLFNTNELPLYDIWFGGEILNYYYFGHYIGYVVLSLTFIPTVPGFFVLIIWIFGIVGINVYRFGFDLFKYLYKKSSASNLKAGLAGVGSIFFVMFAGSFHTLIWLYSYFQYLFLNYSKPSYWYADPTRFIPGAIHEMPFYGFLVSDLHPQVWGLLTGIFGVSICIHIWIDRVRNFDLKNKYVYISCFVLGISYMLNSWDVVTIGALLVSSMIIRYRKSIRKNVLKSLLTLIFMIIFSYGLTLPWSIFFKAPISGFGIVKKISPVLKWLALWGPFLLLFIVYFLNYPKIVYKYIKEGKLSNIKLFPLFIFLLSLFFWIFMEIFYVKDILTEGEHFRANTYNKISIQIWLWMGLTLGPLAIILIVKKYKKIWGYLSIIILWFVTVVQVLYPIKAVEQAYPPSKEFIGISRGLDWWKNKYPEDFEGYLYLKQVRHKLPSDDKVRHIMEAEGDSFKDNNFFSTFLGWPTPLGWYGHEWTWQGSDENLGSRKEDVRQFFTGLEMDKKVELLNNYEIDYIILGQSERTRYGDLLQIDKITDLGEVVFSNEEIRIIAYSKRAQAFNNR